MLTCCYRRDRPRRRSRPGRHATKPPARRESRPRWRGRSGTGRAPRARLGRPSETPGDLVGDVNIVRPGWHGQGDDHLAAVLEQLVAVDVEPDLLADYLVRHRVRAI